jgi:hypothetical protein
VLCESGCAECRELVRILLRRGKLCNGKCGSWIAGGKRFTVLFNGRLSASRGLFLFHVSTTTAGKTLSGN